MKPTKSGLDQSRRNRSSTHHPIPTNVHSPAFHRLISSHLSEVDPVCQEIKLHLEKIALKKLGFVTDLLTREFLNNAILHGHCQIADKKVSVCMMIGRKWVCVQITDQGPGFNWRQARREVSPDDMATCGRGIRIGFAYADRITFNRKGNRVSFWILKDRKGVLSHHGKSHH